MQVQIDIFHVNQMEVSVYTISVTEKAFLGFREIFDSQFM